MIRLIPAWVKRRAAQWALRHLDPELGEWRTCKGTHWQLSSIHLKVAMFEGSELELRYVQPVDLIPLVSSDWPTFPDVPAHELLPGHWRVPD